jgi:hypothetical protein
MGDQDRAGGRSERRRSVIIVPPVVVPKPLCGRTRECQVRSRQLVDGATRHSSGLLLRAFAAVFAGFVRLFPGEPWAKTPDMIEKFKLDDVASHK